MKRTRYVAAHLGKELHKLVKVKCAERDLSIGEAVEMGLKLLLDIKDEDIEREQVEVEEIA